MSESFSRTLNSKLGKITACPSSFEFFLGLSRPARTQKKFGAENCSSHKLGSLHGTFITAHLQTKGTPFRSSQYTSYALQSFVSMRKDHLMFVEERLSGFGDLCLLRQRKEHVKEDTEGVSGMRKHYPGLLK